MSDDLIGRTLGHYHIEEKIGAGGMATVYMAYQPGLDRNVAIKILSPEHAEQPGFSERFQREAKAAASLQHPNILPVYDFGEEMGYSFIVMRCVMSCIEGAHTLREAMANPLSLAQVADIIGQVAAALDHAHQRGIIHRDVKPSNVLMDGDWVFLADFGLAKMTETSVKLTGSGVGIGTPAYMSPEQGRGGKVDHRTDIYSLGVILFEMLTDQIPHDADTPLAIVLKRMTEPLPSPRDINPDIPEAVEQVILKALSRKPDERFASAGAMAAALKEAVSKSATPVTEGVEKPSAPTRILIGSAFSWKWVAGIGAAVAIIALLVMGFSSGLVGTGRPATTPAMTTVAALAPTATAAVPTTTDTPLPTSASTPQPTSTNTPLPTSASTPQPTSTNTPEPTSTNTPLPTPTSSPEPTPTNTPSPTPTPVPTPALGDTWVRPADGMVMVYVPASMFVIGSTQGRSNEQPVNAVALDGFWIDSTEVTNAQYKKCVDAGACSPPQSLRSRTHDSYYGNPQFDDYPVVYVDWHQARGYAAWVGGHLPTEAEWEYAACGPSGYIYPWGNDAPTGTLLNYNFNVGDTTKVGSYPDGASWCGALDMAGNVWEWTQSLYKDYPYDPADGREDLDAAGDRVLRGRCFTCPAQYVRCAFRNGNASNFASDYIGFRVCVESR